MHADLLAQRVVQLIEGAVFPHLDPGSVIGVIALLLAGAGFVTVRDYALGGGDRLPLLVAEPFPRVEASIGIVPAVVASSSPDEVLTSRLARYAQHPAVDGLVVVGAGAGPVPMPRTVGGVPLRAAIATLRTVGPTP
ncbi:hypothetical protein EV188_10279 [Actinomycetospora succinea]|uniref:Uncharacterized protein n=1 Tax=Actinomycetospora succinea TaxID=663603 RepID=A0A4R6VKI2_9PSEU|nr:hypothetical protein [Actinomycetospora succinea]TDQ62425.1 hypothetical protein EV188_10279 [Actinomycetospora succinea]